MASHNPQIFVNIPITSLSASIAFYTAIGFTPEPKFSDAHTMMMVYSPTIYVMLIEPPRFKDFMPADRAIADARKTTEVLLCLSVASKEGVDEMLEKAVKAGGKGDAAKKEEIGDKMYGRSFEDLDGHIWEAVWMSEKAVEEGC